MSESVYDTESITVTGTRDAIDRLEIMIQNLHHLTRCGHSVGVYTDDMPKVCIGSFDGDGASRFSQYVTSYGKVWDNKMPYSGKILEIPKDACPWCGNEEVEIQQCGNPDREGIPVCMTCGECGASGPWGYAPSEEAMEKVALKLWRKKERKEPSL